VQAAVLLLANLVEIQSNRLDRRNEEFKTFQTTFLKSFHKAQREALGRLDEILRRLTEKH
jgi:hypothetical protein